MQAFMRSFYMNVLTICRNIPTQKTPYDSRRYAVVAGYHILLYNKIYYIGYVIYRYRP